jgi:hemerythrin HHE cation binding domain-containing protein
MADIAELITADHRRIERLCRTLSATARYGSQSGPDWMPGHVWQRLADLLAAHTQAEEETCYASMSWAGAQASGPIRDPAADHDDIRKLIGEASSSPVGSAPWWHAVRTVMTVSAEHHQREERYVLPSCVLGLDMNQRKELGRQWCAFMAAWSRDGARPAGTPHQPV